MENVRLSSAPRVAAIAISVVLAACSGGGGGDSSAPAPVTPTTMTGTVATGAALANAAVTIIDSAGKTAAASGNTQGVYTVSISGMVAPFVLVATDPAGRNEPLVSVLASLPTGSAPAVANVTTLTTAVAALLTSDGNPLDLTNTGQASALVTPNAVNVAVTTLDTALANLLAANQVTAQGFNPVTSAFTANRTGADAVLDAVNLMPGSGATLLVSTADPTQALALHNQTSASPKALPAPPAAANYVDYLQSALQACFGATSSCTTGVDATFLDNGYSSLNAEYPDLGASGSAGATLGLPKTLRFYHVNGVWHADVRFDYVLPSGKQGSILTTVQQQPVKLPDGSTQQWNVIGNQLKYDVTIRFAIVRRMFEQSNYVSNYEAGLEIRIPQGGVNAAVNSVYVTGPGVSGVWLERRNASGNTNMTIPVTTPTTAPTTATTTNSNTDIFRWSWQAVDSSQTYAPASPAPSYYAIHQVSASAIALFSPYIVTLYDTTGAQLAQLSVTNQAVPFDASMGAAVVWNALAGTTAADVLSPSGALAGAQANIPVTWTNIASGQYSNIPLAHPVTTAQIQSAPQPGTSTVTAIDGFATGLPVSGSNNVLSTSITAGVDQNGTPTCTAPCQFLALTTGYYRDIQLDWNEKLARVYDIYQYNDY